MSKKGTINPLETAHTIRRLTQLFNPAQFDLTGKDEIWLFYYHSIICEILIHLRDLLEKLKKEGIEIKRSDSIIEQSNLKEKNITELITYCRDACCHNDSHKRRTSAGVLYSQNVHRAFDYTDDVTIIFGDNKLLVRRHLIWLYKRVVNEFKNISEVSNQPVFQQCISYFEADIKSPVLFTGD